MIEKQIASLKLENYYLPTNTYTNIGGMNASKTTMTWSNINLRTVLGDMWDKYNYFNINLVEISTTISPTGAPTGALCCQNIYLSGLPFINATYDAQTKLNLNKTIITTFNFGLVNVATNKLYNGINYYTFRKEQEQCDITIFYNTIGTNTLPVANFPNTTFIFNITGVEIDDNINMKSRMIK